MTVQTPTVTLRDLQARDLDRLIRWRNDPEIHQWFRGQDGALAWEEHINWFQSRPDGRIDRIIEYRDNPVGYADIAIDGDVGIYIGERRLWGRGIATRALQTLIAGEEDRTLTAEIHRENIRSQRLFESVGFRATDVGGPWFQYRYEP